MKWTLILITLGTIGAGCALNQPMTSSAKANMNNAVTNENPKIKVDEDTGKPEIGKPITRTVPPSKKEKMLNWQNKNPEEKSPERKDKVVLSDAEWKKKLTGEQYRILRSHGTDPAYCGILLDNKDEGQYHCAGCDLPLFVTEHKFNSGTGWPSFHTPYARENIWFKTDLSFGMERVEVLCSRCDGHLGHVFPDGPAPSRMRFCINGSAMVFHKFIDSGKISPEPN